GSDLQRPLCGKPVVDGSDAALAIEMTRGIVRPWYANPADFAAVKLGRFVTHDVLENQRRGPCRDRQPVRLDPVVKMISCDNSPGAGHVLDDPGRISNDLFIDMARDQPGVLVVSPARRVADDESQCLVFEKILRSRCGRRAAD